MLGIRVGHAPRLEGSTGPGQQTPAVVTLPGAQHAPLAVGMRPEAQQSGPTGMWKIGRHAFLFGPPGAAPDGQQTPDDVAWLARQHAPPAGT
jgi:hypothetical protein